jgi:outer membrane protein assembly factor BamB
VELPEDERPPILLTAPTVEYHYPQNRTRNIILMLTLIILIAGTAVIVPYILFGSGSESRTAPGVKIYSIVNAQLVPDTNELLGITYNSDESRRPAMLDFNQDDPLRWQGDNLGDDSFQAKFLVVGKQFITAMDTRLYAVNRVYGDKLWETSLSDQLQVGCETCLQSSDLKVYALTQIGKLHAYDLATGKQLWSVSLTTTPRALYLFSNGPAVVDEMDGVPTIVIFDPANGQILQQIAPVCPNHTFENDPQEFGLYSTLWPAVDNSYFYVAYGFWEPGCLEKWDAVKGQRVYQTLLPEDLVRNDLIQLMTEDAIYFSPTSSGQTWMLETSSGAARALTSDKDYYTRPVAAQGDVVVIEAKRTRGSTRYELWGIDRQSGERLWQFIPQAEDSFSDTASSIMDSGGAFAVHATQYGLSLLQVFDDPARITLERLDFQTGVSQGPFSYTPRESSIFSLQVIGWRADQVWLDSDGILVLDLSSGVLVYSWP